MSDISANSSANIVKVSEIGMAFGREYYTVLSREPSRLHHFYAKNSTLLHAEEGDLDTPISVGSEAIQNAVNKNSFHGSRFIIGSIDCHPSHNGGILVNVLGQIQKRGQATGSSRHFMQTFFLAEQPSGYFILNDNLRFLDRPEAAAPTPAANTTAATTTNEAAKPAPSASTAAPATTESASKAVVAATTNASATTAESIEKAAASEAKAASAAPQATESATTAAAAAPAKVKKVTTSSAKQQKAAPAAPVEEESIPASGPSSWAQLAAVQQNKWASGVVSHNKGTSIPSEEKSSNSNSNSSKPIQARKKTDSANSNASSNSAVNSNNNNANKTSSSESNHRHSGSNTSTGSKLPFVPEASLYITGVTNELKAEEIRSEFAALGSLAHFDVKYNSGAAFVEYVDPAIAKILLEEGGIVVGGTRLTVEKRRVASRNSQGSAAGSDNSAASKEKKFIPTKSNRRERPNKAPAAASA